MSRNPHLRNWPECLTKMTAAELKDTVAHWKCRAKYLGDPSAKKEALNKARQAERELASRTENQISGLSN
jgi:hypothetical protein